VQQQSVQQDLVGDKGWVCGYIQPSGDGVVRGYIQPFRIESCSLATKYQAEALLNGSHKSVKMSFLITFMPPSIFSKEIFTFTLKWGFKWKVNLYGVNSASASVFINCRIS